MNILAVGAHPDDIELLCAATLAKYAKSGHKVFICHLCTGDKGHFEIPPEELRKIRDKEAEKAAAVIGAKHLKLDFPDCELHHNLQSVTKTVEIIRQAQPDIIITHSPSDYMPDHVITSQVVFDASFHATLPSFSAGGRPTSLIPPIYYMDTLAGVEFLPEEYVDITETMETKRQMLLCHQSQYQWLKEHDNIDTLEFIEIMARMRGLQCGVKYAEAFKRCKVWGRNPIRRLLP
ncbi:MAG: PIG-L family deacetylase [Candidatus Latescibacteria bacterium]|nr:PIG-L family deacetylase [Candidatus Latescibacterota bacterium]